ncbi:MAG TPA: winged helix-turn-helix domain-containing protein [Mycobacteriales bacterium]
MTTPLRPVLTEQGRRYAVAAIVVQDNSDDADTTELAALAARLADDARRLLQDSTPEATFTAAVSVSADEPADRAPAPVIAVDREMRRATVAGRPMELSYREFELLAFLAEHSRRVFSRRQLLSAVWEGAPVGSRTIDVHVRRLRVKLGAEAGRLSTIRNVGYRLDTGAPAALSVA